MCKISDARITFIRYLLAAILCAVIFLPRGAIAATPANNQQCTNVVSCVQNQFSKKFPFDLLGNIPKDKITCPKVSFSFYLISRDFDFCFLYDFIKILKYPIAAALLMKIYIFS